LILKALLNHTKITDFEQKIGSVNTG